jgi:exopolysaccharide biosynthesis polyprenyl glycosylphosphotransferase
MTSPASLLQQWLRPATRRGADDVAPSHLSPIAGGRAEPDDHAWATSNVRRHLFRTSARVALLLALDLLALVALDAVLHQLRELPLLALGVLDVVHVVGSPGLVGSPQNVGGWGPFAFAVILALAATGNYGAGDRRRDPQHLLLACTLAMALVLWRPLWDRPIPVATQYAATVVLLAAALSLTRRMLDVAVRYTRPIRSAAPRTMLIGRGSDCMASLGRVAFADEYGFTVVGLIDTDSPASPTAAGNSTDLERALRAANVDTVVLCGAVDEKLVARVVRAATIAQCEVLAASQTLELAGVRPEIVCRRGQPFIELRAAALRGEQLVAKRALDLVVASAALVVLAPVLLLIAAAIRLETRGPIVFGHRRAGRHGRPFMCYKFRSMHTDAERILHSNPELYVEYLRNDYKLPPDRDPRITRVGRFLRTTSLDELPQLWNVVRGDMSLVGPRAIMLDELRHYGAEQPLFLSLKPGITGVWQVNGRSNIHYPHRTVIELGYVRSWSLARDLTILLRTIPAVLSRRGAH